MMNFHLLHALCEDLYKFGSEKVLDSSAYYHLNLALKTAYPTTSVKRASKMQESPCALAWIFRGLQRKERQRSKN